VGNAGTFNRLFPATAWTFDIYRVLKLKVWWVASTLVSYFILPAIVISLLPNHRFRDCNLSFSGFLQHIWIYFALFGAVLPIIWLASLTPSFYTYYPMYSQAGRSWADLLVWESLYAVQFIALEFFFRGFLVGALTRHIGILSVPVCVMPYMMIHFVKPWPEVVGAVVAGLVLGALAWKTKSIWGGVCVHTAVACTMDLLALGHIGHRPWLHK
jgi:membrane protease YdiL (CAAX protease family)